MDFLHGASAKPGKAALESCAAVERLFLERRAGRVVGPEGCDPLAWELLLVWEARQYEHETLACSPSLRSPEGDPGDPEGGEDHEHVFVDGECRGCGLQMKNGVMGYGLLDKEGEGYEIGDTGFKTKGSRRIISCEHKRHKSLPTGELLCLDCGSVGN